MSENESLVVVVLHGALANCHVKYARAECCDDKARVMEMPGFLLRRTRSHVCETAVPRRRSTCFSKNVILARTFPTAAWGGVPSHLRA